MQQKKKIYGSSSYIYGLMLTKMAFVFIKKQKLNYADMLRRKTKHAYQLYQLQFPKWLNLKTFLEPIILPSVVGTAKSSKIILLYLNKIFMFLLATLDSLRVTVLTKHLQDLDHNDLKDTKLSSSKFRYTVGTLYHDCFIFSCSGSRIPVAWWKVTLSLSITVA